MTEPRRDEGQGEGEDEDQQPQAAGPRSGSRSGEVDAEDWQPVTRPARTTTDTSTSTIVSASLPSPPTSNLHDRPQTADDSSSPRKIPRPGLVSTLQRRLTNFLPDRPNKNTTYKQRPAARSYCKSSSALPTLNTIAAVSGTAIPSAEPSRSDTPPRKMASHEGLNPHTASDLLRQAMMQNRPVGDDDHDHIGSNSSTPPGAATPRPDPADKRLPGILHSYFGQVRDSFRTQPKSEDSSAPPPALSSTTQAQCGNNDVAHHNVNNGGASTLPTAPCSPTDTHDEKQSSSLPLSSEKADVQPQNTSINPLPFFYPTPPASSSSSMHQVCQEELGTIGSGRSSGRTLSTRDRKDDTHSTPTKSRRHTFVTSSPLCGVVTTSAVPAAHISNPATRRPSEALPPDSSDPPSSSTASRRVSVSKAQEKVERLTEGGITPPRSQNTPPQTPRSQSHESKSAQTPSKLGRTTSTQSNGVKAPKGKLTVSITEGRGLRPSTDPYVVCQFQWAEYISDGPRGHGSGKREGHGPGGIMMKRTESDMGQPRAIPMRSRQSSNTGISSDPKENGKYTTQPHWDHEAVFDVVGDHSEVDVSVFDKANGEAFLGHVRFCPNLIEYERPIDSWFPLVAREGEADEVSGEIRLRINFQQDVEKRHIGPEDFSILKLIGKGTFGQVFQVRKKDTRRIYAMKVLSKKVIVQKKEVAHTLGERNILVRTAMSDSLFIVGLKFSFQTPADLYLVTDFMSGGELFWHLQKEGRFLENRAKFYIAELILALQHLHNHDIVYRDLKPENILLDAKGHIALCDFGLSKANLTDDATTNTFCGTTEYLAPEVLLDEHGYTKMVDFWSLGVLVFEMCCGWSPFYAEDTQQMYKNIAFGKVRFPRDALSTEGRNFVKGLLNRNPKHRLGATRDAEELKAHPFFADIDWVALAKKNVAPPFKPKLKSEEDTSNFDPEFTNALNTGVGSLNARAAALTSGAAAASTPLSPTMQANFKGFTFVDESSMDKHFSGRDTMDRMDEDDDDWDKPFPAKNGNRMSGIISNDNDDSFFGTGRIDDV